MVKNVLLTILSVWVIILAISVLFAVFLSDKLTQPLLVLNLAAKRRQIPPGAVASAGEANGNHRSGHQLQ